jgi:hypothetical protein
VLTVQYLEGGRDWTGTDPAAVSARLRDAFARLPIDAVAVGWGVPSRLIEACAEESSRAGAALYRWHLLLAGDGTFAAEPEWRVVGLGGEPIPGYQRLDEFTFACPNNPAGRAAVLEHVGAIARERPWGGLMLDRMRFPSPALDPATHLGCFCRHCERAAAEHGLDLAEMRAELMGMLTMREGRHRMASELLAGTAGLFRFRAASIASLIAEVADVLHATGQKLGLDCFSPSIAPMVGQDLSDLGQLADWVKVMTYGHALGPAGIPFELAALADWLVDSGTADEGAAMRLLEDATGLPLPPTVARLRRDGIPPAGLAAEARRARAATSVPALAGIELVDVPGQCELSERQIRADLAAFRSAGLDGLALSWDLWRTPPARLELVAAG